MDLLRPFLTGINPQIAGLYNTKAYMASLLTGAVGKPLDLLYSRLGGVTGNFFPGTHLCTCTGAAASAIHTARACQHGRDHRHATNGLYSSQLLRQLHVFQWW
jgi:hypothetical protein